MHPPLPEGRRLITARGEGRVVIDGVDTIMFGSNDYLGLSTHRQVIERTAEALRQYGAGTGIYPVFATTPLHEALCDALASFLGVEAVALFSSGGSANAGVLATLVGEGDAILSDRLNHASIIDGCRLSRADVVAYRNRDTADLAEALQRTASARRRLVVTDGIFSMEGGAAPLAEIHRLARAAGAIIMIDEAHATGVVGPDGTGTAPLFGLSNAAPGVVLTGSLSKALGGASGGFVAGPAEIIDTLRAKSRSWRFTMGMTTANAATALAALDVHREDPAILARLWDNVRRLREGLVAGGAEPFASDSAITAVRIGDEDRTRLVSAALLHQGVYAPAMTFPIVARGEARLRLQVSASHSAADVAFASGEIVRALQAVPA